MTRALLISNAKRDGMGYLEHAQEQIDDFLGPVERVLFVPYAAITKSYDRYVEDVTPAVAEHGGREVVGIHTVPDPAAAVAEAQAVMVGGGNTWMLHRLMRQQGLIEAIRERALAGMPYFGWSAGANIACPTIMTSNDMVVVDPLDLEALGLVPFQVNPHYLHGNPPGFHGETRETRIVEYLEVNRAVTVVGLREGMMLRLEGGNLELLGIDDTLRVFRHGREPVELGKDADLAFLLG